MTSSTVLSMFSRTRACSSSASFEVGASRNAVRRMPASPERSADSRGSGTSVQLPRSGRSRCRSSTRSARSPRSSRVSACPRSRRSARAHSTPAAPQKRSFSGLVARQRSQSSARQRSFGPRSAASVSATISRMPARIRCLVPRLVAQRLEVLRPVEHDVRRRRERAARRLARGASSAPDARSGGCARASRWNARPTSSSVRGCWPSSP